MKHATATVTNHTGTAPRMVRVSVAVERPDRPELSYLRCTDDAPDNFRAAAISGAGYARNAVDRNRVRIEVLSIEGGHGDPGSEEGVILATMFAIWLAWGHRWTVAEAREASGWVLDVTACP